MDRIIQWDPVAEGYRGSKQFKEYLESEGIIETKKGHYRVASDMTREDAINRLVSLSGDMMMEFDALPSGVDPRRKTLHFGNQFGVFFIDGITNPIEHFYERELKDEISNNHTVTGIRIKYVNTLAHNYFGDISLTDFNDECAAYDWEAEPKEKGYRKFHVVPELIITPKQTSMGEGRFTRFPQVDKDIRKKIDASIREFNSESKLR